MITQAKWSAKEIAELIQRWRMYPGICLFQLDNMAVDNPQDANCIVCIMDIDQKLLDCTPEPENYIELEKANYVEGMRQEASMFNRTMTDVETVRVGVVAKENYFADITILRGRLGECG